MSDQTLRSCPPDGTALDAFDACINSFGMGLDRSALPSTDNSVLGEMRAIIDLLRQCHSSQLHEDVTMREWPAGCPQQGPATIPRADALDRNFRAQYYAMLIADDSAIRTSLSVATVAPPTLTS